MNVFIETDIAVYKKHVMKIFIKYRSFQTKKGVYKGPDA